MQRRILPFLVFLFPFLYYFRFVAPNSGMLVLQNDFTLLYYNYKAYFLDSWAHGHFPYWLPAEGAGYSNFANPFVGILYPLNLVLLLIRVTTGVYGIWFHQIFTILGVAIFALGLYRWLVRTHDQPLAAAFAAGVISTCWGIGEFLRFPNAIHVMAWVPWVLGALHGIHHERKLRHVYAAAAAVFCQITAGYPYFVVYSFLLYAAYLLYLHVTTSFAEWKPRVGRQALAFGIPFLVSLPYTGAVSALMAVTTDRGGGDFNYAANEYTYGPVEFVGALIYPPVSTVEGCIYMSSLAVVLIALYFWRGKDVREKAALLVGIIGFVSLIFGFRSFLFAPVWSFVPVLNQMRVFGRMMAILMPLFAVAVHQGFAFVTSELESPPAERQLTPRIVCALFGGIFVVQAFLYASREKLDVNYLGLTAPWLPAGTGEADFLLNTIIALAVVLVLLQIDWSRLKSRRWIWLGVLLWAVALDTGTHGRLLWAKPITRHLAEIGAPANKNIAVRIAQAARIEGKFYPLVQDYFELGRAGGMGLTNAGLSRGVVPNWDYQSYATFLSESAADPASRDELLGKNKLYFHEKLPANAKGLLADAHAIPDGPSALAVKSFDGNELQLAVTTSRPGYVSWIDNWDQGWKATVDGNPAPVEKLLGTFKTVSVPTPGKHTVTFRYRPVISGVARVGCALGLVLLFLPIVVPLRRRARAAAGEVAPSLAAD
jgi:hypothetical protein